MNQKELFTFKKYLHTKYKFPEIVLSLKSDLFNFHVMGLNCDVLYALERADSPKILDKLSLLKRYKTSSSNLLTKKFYLVLVDYEPILSYKEIEV